MENQNNQPNETSGLVRLGLLGIAAAGIMYLLKQEPDTRENPNSEDDTDSKKSEPETVKKYAEEIDEDIAMNVRKSAEHEKGSWIAVLCQADGQDSDQCFFGDSKKEAIEKAFQKALSYYKEAIDK